MSLKVVPRILYKHLVSHWKKRRKWHYICIGISSQQELMLFGPERKKTKNLTFIAARSIAASPGPRDYPGHCTESLFSYFLGPWK